MKRYRQMVGQRLTDPSKANRLAACTRWRLLYIPTTGRWPSLGWGYFRAFSFWRAGGVFLAYKASGVAIRYARPFACNLRAKIWGIRNSSRISSPVDWICALFSGPTKRYSGLAQWAVGARTTSYTFTLSGFSAIPLRNPRDRAVFARTT